MGGAQPLAVTLNGGVGLFVEVDRERIERRLRLRLRRPGHGVAGRGAPVGREARARREAAFDRAPRQRRRGPSRARRGAESASTSSPIRPPPTTCSTATSQRMLTVDEASSAPRARPGGVSRAGLRVDRRARARDARVPARRGHRLRLRQQPARRRRERRRRDAFAIPGFVPAYIRPLFCEGQGPFRWVALSGDPEDIYATDERSSDAFPENESLVPLDPPGPRAGQLSGAAGAHLLARLRRAGPGRARSSTTWSRAAS